jgi:hypothetical protein
MLGTVSWRTVCAAAALLAALLAGAALHQSSVPVGAHLAPAMNLAHMNADVAYAVAAAGSMAGAAGTGSEATRKAGSHGSSSTGASSTSGSASTGSPTGSITSSDSVMGLSSLGPALQGLGHRAADGFSRLKGWAGAVPVLLLCCVPRLCLSADVILPCAGFLAASSHAPPHCLQHHVTQHPRLHMTSTSRCCRQHSAGM